jgi:signal transduction histidine kinase
LQEASRLKSEFVSTVSHELRTPLNIIMGYLEMGRDEAISEPERRDCLDHIDDASRELLKLIENTLEIGKLEAGRGETRFEPVSVHAFWRELGAECVRFPRRPGVSLEWRELASPLTVSTDPRKLSMVIRNLVSNALKFTEQGWVVAAIDVEPTHLRIRVTDTGIGIGPEDRETIFEMFRQVDGSDKRSYGGVGLGLYLVRRFVEQLGGTVRFESERGTGTTFTIHIPHGAEHAATPSRDAA